MRKKLVFLDFDGVLNSHAWREGNVYKNKPSFEADRLAWYLGNIDPAAVQRVDRIIQETDAYIVISSSWRSHTSRYGSAQFLGSLLARRGLQDARRRVIGLTPEDDMRTAKDIHRARSRWEEIRAYLDGSDEWSAFIILDDDYMTDAPADAMVRTDRHLGLTDADAERAIGILNV